MLESLIAKNQSAFFLGRQLLDSVLVANEIVDYSTRVKNECLLFKVYFEEAYDMVS